MQTLHTFVRAHQGISSPSSSRNLKVPYGLRPVIQVLLVDQDALLALNMVEHLLGLLIVQRAAEAAPDQSDFR